MSDVLNQLRDHMNNLDATDERLEAEAWVNEAVRLMMEAYREHGKKKILAAVLVDTASAKVGKQTDAMGDLQKSVVGRWMLRGSTERFNNRLEAALRTILREEILGQ